MPTTAVNVQCPGCGEPWATSDRHCQYCGRPVLINSMSEMLAMDARSAKALRSTYEEALGKGADNPELYAALGMAFLRLGLPDRALRHFEDASDREVDNSEVYFYTAVALLAGKRPFRTPISTIREAERYLTAAMRLERRGIYSYLHAYICKDFYERKFLKVPLPAAHHLERAVIEGVTDFDIQGMFELLEIDSSTVPLPTRVTR